MLFCAKVTFFHLIEQLFEKHSYLCSRKSNRGVVQLASILAWGASGRPFESGHSDKRAAEQSAAFFCINQTKNGHLKRDDRFV